MSDYGFNDYDMIAEMDDSCEMPTHIEDRFAVKLKKVKEPKKKNTIKVEEPIADVGNPSVLEMRQVVCKAYGDAEKWVVRVKGMPDVQVYAIYRRLKNK